MMRTLAWLLHHANAHPGCMKESFYAVKDRILTAYGTPDGEDIQHVVKECWGPYGGGSCDEHCDKCGGTGIFCQHWTRLQRYRMDRYVFHRPIGMLVSKPKVVQIEGLIRHRYYPDLSRECIGVLFYRYDPAAFNRWLSAYGFCLPKLRLLTQLAVGQLPSIPENPDPVVHTTSVLVLTP